MATHQVISPVSEDSFYTISNRRQVYYTINSNLASNVTLKSQPKQYQHTDMILKQIVWQSKNIINIDHGGIDHCYTDHSLLYFEKLRALMKIEFLSLNLLVWFQNL